MGKRVMIILTIGLSITLMGMAFRKAQRDSCLVGVIATMSVLFPRVEITSEFENAAKRLCEGALK
jgi:hypothetical protein